MFNRFIRTADPTQPWLLTEGALRSIMATAAEKSESFDAIAKKWGEHLEGSWETEMHGSVAVIPVSGVLMRRMSFWGFLSGSSAYEILLKEVAAALGNPQVKAVILDVDSPGGEVTGCAEIAQHLFDLRGGKPLVAYATGNCASAAYWLASACDEVVVSPTSLVGSIGVVKSLRDYTKMFENAGVTEIEIVSSQSPYKRTDPASKEGRSREQAQVDALAEVFVEAVARNRAVSRSKVIEDFGQGDCLVGQLAVEAGLADRVGSLEALIEELGAHAPAATGEASMSMTRARSTKASARIAAKANEEDKDLAEDEDENAVDEDEQANDEQDSADDEETGAEGDDDETAEGEEDETAEDDEESAEDEEEPKSKGKAKSKAKASGEKARIAGILRHAEASGRGQLAEYLAFDTSMSVAAAAKILKASPKAGGAAKGGLAKAMSGKNPNVRAGSAAAGGSDDDKAIAQLAWAAKHLQGA